jgi:hypothetical protein
VTISTFVWTVRLKHQSYKILLHSAGLSIFFTKGYLNRYAAPCKYRFTWDYRVISTRDIVLSNGGRGFAVVMWRQWPPCTGLVIDVCLYHILIIFILYSLTATSLDQPMNRRNIYWEHIRAKELRTMVSTFWLKRFPNTHQCSKKYWCDTVMLLRPYHLQIISTTHPGIAVNG